MVYSIDGYENILYGLIIVVALVGCFWKGYTDCVEIIVSGIIGAYTGNALVVHRGGISGVKKSVGVGSGIDSGVADDKVGSIDKCENPVMMDVSGMDSC